MYSPIPITCIFLCYLITVWLGPKLMAHRQPVNIKAILIVYNFSMVCLSAYMFYEVSQNRIHIDVHSQGIGEGLLIISSVTLLYAE